MTRDTPRCDAASRHVRTCATGVWRCTTVGAHVCHGRVALHHGGCARVHGACDAASRHARTCARSVRRCITACARVCTEHATLHHGRRARVHGACDAASRQARTCTWGVRRCITACAHACTGRATLYRGMCARRTIPASMDASAPTFALPSRAAGERLILNADHAVRERRWTPSTCFPRRRTSRPRWCTRDRRASHARRAGLQSTDR